ncbi:1,4-dihydroxy-2-naphthoyl-CoA synthase [Trifolium repens]|nr:1,4-dihydroxy-2-naphthoyl-CoA synthase [Trifolium repens]
MATHKEPQTPSSFSFVQSFNISVVLLQFLRRSPLILRLSPRFQGINSILLSVNQRSPFGTNAFSSGGDQALRIEDGYSDHENIGRLNVLDLQVAEYAFVGGHVLHMVCDSTMQHIMLFSAKQVLRFCSKKACKKWFLTRFYTADKAEKTGLINTVVRHLHFVASNLVLKHSSSIEAAEESSDGRRSESS